jgi:hypothetical protein
MTSRTEEEKMAFYDRVMGMEVFDTHSHLVGDALGARSFWEIAHYFWLNREMQAGGYPAHAEELPEEERIDAFVAAYRATRSTLMNIAFTEIMRSLYGVTIRDAASVKAAIEAVKARQGDEGWTQETADRIGAKRFVVNRPEHAEFMHMRSPAVLVPRIDGALGQWQKTIAASQDPAGSFEQTAGEIRHNLEAYKASGCPGIMTTLPAYAASANRRYTIGPGSSSDEILMELLHEVCAGAERNGLFVQLFLGVERSWCGEAVPSNDTQRILKLSALFDTYRCAFELVLAAELNNLDAVQAAWNFPNVSVGGMWWFNFRGSTYRDSMQYRLEALPASQSSIVVSDARNMEWCFGKIWIIKRLTAEFLWERLAAGWIDEETALHTAEEWLYRSAARRYGCDETVPTP